MLYSSFYDLLSIKFPTNRSSRVKVYGFVVQLVVAQQLVQVSGLQAILLLSVGGRPVNMLC